MNEPTKVNTTFEKKTSELLTLSAFSPSNINFTIHTIPQDQLKPYKDLIETTVETTENNPEQPEQSESSLVEIGGNKQNNLETISIKIVEVNRNTTTVSVTVGNNKCCFTIPTKFLIKWLKKWLKILSIEFSIATSWAAIASAIPITHFPALIAKTACFVSYDPEVTIPRLRYDVDKYIYFGTLLGRGIILPILHAAMKKIAEHFNKKDKFQEFEKWMLSLEENLLLAAAAFAIIGLNPLLPASFLATNYFFIPAGLLAVMPLLNFVYGWKINPTHFRGSYSEYQKQHMASTVKSAVFASLEALFGAITSVSLITTVVDDIIQTMVNAALEVDLSPEEVNNILIPFTVIFGILGLTSALHSNLWKGMSAVSAGLGVFWGFYNPLLALITCLRSGDFSPSMFVKQGFIWPYLMAALGLPFGIGASVLAYNELSRVIDEGVKTLEGDKLSTLPVVQAPPLSDPEKPESLLNEQPLINVNDEPIIVDTKDPWDEDSTVYDSKASSLEEDDNYNCLEQTKNYLNYAKNSISNFSTYIGSFFKKNEQVPVDDPPYSATTDAENTSLLSQSQYDSRSS